MNIYKETRDGFVKKIDELDRNQRLWRTIIFFSRSPFVKKITIFNKKQKKIAIHTYGESDKKTFGTVNRA